MIGSQAGSLDTARAGRYPAFYLFTRAVRASRKSIGRKDSMKTYEAVVIFASDDAQINLGKEFLKKEFEGSGISIKKEEDMGDRLLAYPVRKNDRGHFFLYVIECLPDPLKSLTKSLKLRPEILKYLFVRKDN
jgi:small subunit ribosomal protein S6